MLLAMLPMERTACLHRDVGFVPLCANVVSHFHNVLTDARVLCVVCFFFFSDLLTETVNKSVLCLDCVTPCYTGS